MKNRIGYRKVPFTMNRRMVSASASVGRGRNNIHAILEVDIGEPRRLMRGHRERTGERLSLTAYVIACLARAVAEHPHLNAFRRGNRLVLLDEITISALVERELGGEQVPEPFGIRGAQAKTYRQIHEELRAAQRHAGEHRGEDLGGLSGARWIRLIPVFLLRLFVRAASRSVAMVGRYGAISVTAVGMHGQGALWFLPLSGATVTVTVGGIVERVRLREGRPEAREHLCLAVTFDHDVVDGAPAARFLKRFSQLLEGGEPLREVIAPRAAG